MSPPLPRPLVSRRTNELVNLKTFFTTQHSVNVTTKIFTFALRLNLLETIVTTGPIVVVESIRWWRWRRGFAVLIAFGLAGREKVFVGVFIFVVIIWVVILLFVLFFLFVLQLWGGRSLLQFRFWDDNIPEIDGSKFDNSKFTIEDSSSINYASWHFWPHKNSKLCTFPSLIFNIVSKPASGRGGENILEKLSILSSVFRVWNSGGVTPTKRPEFSSRKVIWNYKFSEEINFFIAVKIHSFHDFFFIK